MKLSIQAKMIISGTLLIFTVVEIFLFNRFVAIPIAIGMLLSMHGDACMARHPLLLKRYKETLPFGIGSFFIAHIFYIGAFIHVLNDTFNGAYLSASFFILYGAGLVLYSIGALFIWSTFVRDSGDTPQPVRIGALLYALMLGVMASFALSLAGSMGGLYWICAVGGLLFMVSDAIIAVSDFGKVPIKNADSWIWLTYVLAQCCIVTLPLIHAL